MKRGVYFCAVASFIFTVMSYSALSLFENRYITPVLVSSYVWHHAVDSESFVAIWNDVVEIYRACYEQAVTYRQKYAFVQHCTLVHEQFLKKLYVDTQHSNILVWIMHDSIDHADLMTMNNYLQESGNQAYALWYALYFDTVSYLFLMHINHMTPVMYNASHTAEYWYAMLSNIISHLSHSSFYTRYTHQLHRYQQLLELSRSWS